jgi:hypothetical protein
MTNIRLSDGRRTALTIHRLLLGLTYGDKREGDHVNLNRLDNRRINLRVVTRAQNSQNRPVMHHTSRYRGVSWYKKLQKWVAKGVKDGRQIHLGYFDDEEEAYRTSLAFRKEHMPFAVHFLSGQD